MAQATIKKITLMENNPAVLLARVQLSNGDDITQADITSVGVRVFNNSTGVEQTPALTPTVASVVFDTLQTDARWTEDEDGYNFAYEVAGSYFPDGAVTYQIEVKITPDTGNPFYLLWQGKTINIYSE